MHAFDGECLFHIVLSYNNLPMEHVHATGKFEFAGFPGCEFDCYALIQWESLTDIEI